MSDAIEQRQTVRIDPGRAEAMAATLGVTVPGIGEPLPPFWHWSQFWVAEPPWNLGRDGHPAAGGFLPDVGLPRRMWAGGAIEFHAPLKIGAEATRTSIVRDVVRKTGRTGPLAFVRVEHRITSEGTLCITEEQQLVFRNDPEPDAPVSEPEAAPKNESVSVSHRVTTTDLFRYSALTFNGHRIHYDVAYAREVEGYPGLVTHGPLLAQRLIELAARELGGLSRFSFRARAPLFHFEGFEACARPDEDGLSLWIRGEDGRLAMTARAD